MKARHEIVFFVVGFSQLGRAGKFDIELIRFRMNLYAIKTRGIDADSWNSDYYQAIYAKNEAISIDLFASRQVEKVKRSREERQTPGVNEKRRNVELCEREIFFMQNGNSKLA